jgi:hypothetical protein
MPSAPRSHPPRPAELLRRAAEALFRFLTKNQAASW